MQRGKKKMEKTLMLAKGEEAGFPSRGQLEREIYQDACEHI